MKQRKSILFLAIMLCLCFVTMVSCGLINPDDQNTPDPQPDPQPTSYSITVDEEIQHGSIQCEVDSAIAGETITVTAEADKNYQLVSITVNGEAIDGYSFTMPEADVVISATFAIAADLVEAVPEGAITIKAQSAGGASATGHFTFTFGENGIALEAYVEDSSIVDKDGVAVLFSRELPVIGGLLKDGQTIKVSVNAKGVVSILATDANGELQAAELEGVTTGFATWSKNGEKLDGYHVEALVPYAVLGATAENAKGSVTVCPVVYSAYGSLPAQATSLEGVYENAQNSYAVLVDDNTVRDNKYKELSAQLGSFGSVAQGDYWDLTKDYYADDAENYPNREALLTGHDGNDNNLVFNKVSANEMYVKATISLTQVYDGNDQYPKFGIMLFDGMSKKGVFFYVDAVMGKPSGNTLDNIIGTAVGCNVAPGPDFGAWTTIKDGVFDLSTKSITLEMVYQDGWVHMYANGTFIKSTYYGAYNENLHFGFKSFCLGMKVTDYIVSADAEADGWADKKIAPPEAQKVDILFAGDSYMEFWNWNGISNSLSYTGATYANAGIGGTRVDEWTAKAKDMSLLYNPTKIAFHISVNDIDDAGADPVAVLDKLYTLFETYHDLFPDATIYWNSLVPNTMFPHKYADYKVVNAGVLEYAADKDWLVYIDQTTSFDLNGAAREDVFSDGLHFNTDVGYPIWANNMLTAMGYERTGSDIMGDIDRFSHTGLWQFNDDGSAYSEGYIDTSLWFKNVSGENVYVEAVISIGALRNGDGYPKFGLLVRNDYEARWGFIDCFGYPNQYNTSAGLVSRSLAVNGGNWNWGGTIWGGATGCDFTNVKIAIAKLGNTVYLLVNDVIYATSTISGDVVVGYESFNLETTIKNVVTSTNVNEIERKLGLTCQDAVIDGEANDDIWTEEVLSNTQKFGDKGDGRYFTVAAVKGTDGVYFYVETYTYENLRASANWWENANIELRFGNNMDTQQYILVDGMGFNGVKSSGGISLSAIKALGNEGNIYHNAFEFFAPYNSFPGFDADSAEINLKVWGWVWDNEGWNNIMNVGEWPTLTVSEHGLRFERHLSVSGENAGVDVEVQSTARVGDTIVATVTVAEGQTLDFIKVNGTAYDVVDGKITFTMPNGDVAIDVALQGISITSNIVDNSGEGLHATVNCADATATVGQTIAFTVSADAASKYVVSVNGEVLTAVGGAYQYTVKATDTSVVVKVELDYDLSEAIDGVKGEGYGDPISFRVNDNRSVTVWARTDDYGVYIYAEVITNTVVTTGAEWHTNSNFEFWLNGHNESAFVNVLGATNLVSRAVYNVSQKENGKYLNTIEFYVNKCHIRNGFDPNNVRLNYCFKVPGENAYMEEMANLRGHSTDWWRTYHSARWAENTDLGVWSEPSCIHITRTGLVDDCDNDPEPKDATIDADFSEYDGLASLTLGNTNTKLDVTGFVGTDGIYLAFTIYHNGVSVKDPNGWSDWSTNDNLEIQLDGLDAVCAIIEDGFVSGGGGLAKYAMVRTYDENKTNGYYYTTMVELYYTCEASVISDGSVSFKLGINGGGFGGWQALIWDANVAYITKDGITK